MEPNKVGVRGRMLPGVTARVYTALKKNPQKLSFSPPTLLGDFVWVVPFLEIDIGVFTVGKRSRLVRDH